MTRQGFTTAFGEMARPFAIWSSSGSAALATVRIAWTGEHFEAAAIFIGAVWAGVGALYIGKAWEKNTEAKHTAQVQISQAASTPAPPAPGTANVQAAPNVTVEVTETSDPPPALRSAGNLEDPA